MTVADWLKSLPNVRNVRPVKVAIGREKLFGAAYTQVSHYTATMTACTRGDVALV